MLDKVKLALRIKDNIFDDEIEDIINACYGDLERGGCPIKISKEAYASNALLVRACILYAKANFGNREDALKNANAYEFLKISLALSGGII